jgi:hypothetical protein
LETKTGGTIDALLMGCVAGVTVIWEISDSGSIWNYLELFYYMTTHYS